MQKGDVIRPSPNEEAEFLRRERERRRVQRLVQVREQSRQHAQRIRTGYQQLCQEEGQFQEKMQRAQHKEENMRKMTLLQNKLKCYIDDVGTGHRSATLTMERAAVAQRQKEAAMEEERLKTDQRYGRALKELNRASQSKKEKKEFHIRARQSALVVERHRAKEVASLPPPQQDLPVTAELSKGHRVIVKGVGGFSCTHYNLPTHSVVQRAGSRDTVGPSGVDGAAETTEMSALVKQDAERQREEREEKAWMRHKHALAQIRLEREHKEGLKELEQLERQYRSARQQQVAEMPANLFQPTQQLLDMKKERQREMERAFEKPCHKPQAPQFAMEWTLSDSSAATPGTTQSAGHDESSQLDSEEGGSHLEPPTPPAPQVHKEEEGTTLHPIVPLRSTALSIGDIDSQLSDSPHTISSEMASEGITPPVTSTLPVHGNNEGHSSGGEEIARRACRGQDTLSVCDIDSCFTASPASEATSSTSPATHVDGVSLSIVDEDEHGNGLLNPSRQLSAVIEEEGECLDEEDDESTLTEEKTDTEEEPNPQPSHSDHDPPPSPPGDGDEDVFSSLSSSDTSQQCTPEGSIQGEEEDTNHPAQGGRGDGAEENHRPGVRAVTLDTDLQTMPINGLEEMLATIRRQHEAWTDYLADAGQGTLPYSHVTVTRPQQQFLPLEDVGDSQVSDPPTPLSVLSLGTSSPGSDDTLSSSLSSRSSGFSWASLPELEPLGPGLNSSTAYSLPGTLTGLSYQPSSQLGRSTADGATVLATPKSSLLSVPTTSPYLVYPLLPAATAGTPFQHTLQLYQQARGHTATALAPPGVIHPRPSPSTTSAAPSGSELLSRGHAHVSVGSTIVPTLTQPTAQPSGQLPHASTAPPLQHHLSHALPVLLPASVSAAGVGAVSVPLPSAAIPTAPFLASTAAAPTLQPGAQRRPSPVASVAHTSTKHSHHSPTVFVPPLTSHSAAATQQAPSSPLYSAPTTHAESHQPSLPLHHFAISTPLGHMNASLDSPPPTSVHIPQKPPVFPITMSSHPLPSPGLSSVRSSTHATTTAAATTHRGYPYSPLLTSPIVSGSDDGELTKSSSSSAEPPTASHPPEHRSQEHAWYQSRSEQPPPHSSEAALHHVYGDSSVESSSTSHLSSLSSLTPHGIIQSLLAHGRREEEGEVALQASTFSPLQSDSSHIEPSDQSEPFISPVAPGVVGHTGSTSDAYNPAQQPDSLPPHSLSASEDDLLPREDSHTNSASAEEKPSMTLQEAFLLKKSLFIQRSQERQKQAMAKAKQSQLKGRGRKKASTESLTATQPSEGGRSSDLVTSTEGSVPSSTEPCHGAGAQPRYTSGRSKRSVTFSSPVTVLQSSGLFSPPEVHNTRGRPKANPMVRKTAQPRAMTKEEMAAVNQRLYGRLPEVQRKRKEQEKIRMNEANRAKAKEYQKKVQDRWRKHKRDGTSSKPHPTATATSKPIHSAPFK